MTVSDTSNCLNSGPPLVLVVDDDPFMREITRIHLEGSGFSVALAQTANEGLEKVRALRPAAVVMDFAMPGGSGADALRTLRSEEGIAATPVVMVTAWSSEESRREVAGMGARWLQKPVTGATLLDVVREMLDVSTPADVS